MDKTKHTTDRILKEASKPIPAESMELIAETMEEIMHHKAGIYALYSDEELYYVGRTRNLKARIKDHMRGKNATSGINLEYF